LLREENRRTRRKTLEAEKRTNNKLNPLMASGPGIKPGPHWWETSALTTAPSLLPHKTPAPPWTWIAGRKFDFFAILKLSPDSC